MSDEKNIDPKATPVPDDLTKTKKPSDIQLNEEELDKASGGISFAYEQIVYQYKTQQKTE